MIAADDNSTDKRNNADKSLIRGENHWYVGLKMVKKQHFGMIAAGDIFYW